MDLSDREYQVMGMIAEGKTVKEIADRKIRLTPTDFEELL
jgi:DNA-binding NarL/FixJ family response regulator